jgi:hypothetical protein
VDPALLIHYFDIFVLNFSAQARQNKICQPSNIESFLSADGQ